MTGEHIYHVVVLNGDTELYIYKNKANRLFPNTQNEFIGNNFKIVLPQFCVMVNFANCNELQNVALVVNDLR